MAVPVKTTAQIREQWESMVDYYTQTSVAMTSKVYRSILPFLRLSEAQTVIEAGCGPGNGIEILRSMLPATTKILANDITQSFLDIVRGKNYPNVDLCDANNEALPYPDAVAERYIANLSLHIVEYPERMLAEAFRVLKSGGIAAFSVWGDRSEATIFDLQVSLHERFSSHIYRNSFHFSDTQLLKDAIRQAGFTRVVTFCEYGHMPLTDISVIETAIMRNPEMKDVFDVLEEGKKEEFLLFLREFVRNEVEVKQHPLTIHARIAIAFKP